jgi:hypothetical protein
MRICPRGHQSPAEDFCDRCGDELGLERADPVAAGCGACGSPLDGRFCEQCGEDAESGTPRPHARRRAARGGAALRPRPPADSDPLGLSAHANHQSPLTGPRWSATVTIDAGYFSAVRAGASRGVTAIAFPRYCPVRRFVLASDRILIGRRSRARGVAPTIDLSGPAEDPGVSRIHAVLVRADPDGWTVVDLNSVNGTNLNGYSAPIRPHRPVPLAEGDMLYLGLWTAIRVGPPG